MASLESLWKEGRDGALSPLEQMRAWALRTAQRDIGGDKAVNLEKIADRVTKVGGGHPTREAIRQFLERVDADPEWYPGKTYRKRPGPQAVLHGKKRKQVAKSAMNLKKEGSEPTYAAIAARCPAAVVNPDTGKPVDKKLVYTVLKTDCYDRNPEDPWVCKPVYTRRFLPDDLMEQRLQWAKRLLQEGYPEHRSMHDMHRRGSASETSDAGRKGRGRRPATTPEHRRGGCIRGRGAVDAEIERRR